MVHFADFPVSFQSWIQTGRNVTVVVLWCFSRRVSDGKLCVRSGAFLRCLCQAGYSHCYLFACILSRSTRQGTRRFWLPITGPYVVAVPTCLHLCVYLEGIPAAVEDAGGLGVATPFASALPPPVPGIPQFCAKACRRMVVQKS